MEFIVTASTIGAVEFRIFVGPNNGATYADLMESARLAEELGYAAFLIADHYTPFAGAGLPGPTDAWTTLAGLARDTSRIRLGTLVTSATFRHPGVLAVIAAQVDAMSGGRIEFGIGAGYFEREHRAYGIPFPSTAERFDRLTEALELISGLWETSVGQTYSYGGQHYQLIDSPALPKPAQTPRPPIILGGTGKIRTPRLAARFADEFNLQTSRRNTPSSEKWLYTTDDVADHIARVRNAAEALGRDPSTIAFSMIAMIGAGRTASEATEHLDPAHYGGQTFDGAVFGGTPAQIVDQLAPYAKLGITRVYVRAPAKLKPLASNYELLATAIGL